MKKLYFLLFLFPLLVSAFVVPEKPTGFVQDYAGMLSVEERQLLETKLSDFEKNTTNEIAVVTISSLDGDVIENVAQDIFTKWGIGKSEKNNGVLFLISLTDRKTRIHTGYGIEGALTDIGTSYIQSDVVTPRFREGKYFDGINGAVDKMIEALGGANIVPENYLNSSNTNSFGNFEFFFWIFIVFFQITLSLLSRSKSWWGGGVLGGILGSILWYFFISSVFVGIPAFILLVLLGLFFDYVVSKSYSNARALGHYPWWMRGGGGGGSSGGGFGGFGGGSSGGGKSQCIEDSPDVVR
jgi:uncharacterized protein